MHPTEHSLTINDIFAVFSRRRHLFVYTVLPVIVAAVSLAVLLPSDYRSSARLDINLEGSNVRTLEPIAVSAYADQYIAKLQDRVLSRDSVKRLLENDEIFTGAYRDLSEKERLQMVRKGFFVEMVTQPATTNTGREIDLISGFRTGFEGPNPNFAYAVSAYIAKAFLDEDRATRTKRASSTSTFLREQVSKTEIEIVELEQQVAEFKVRNACCLPELRELNMAVIQRAERDIESLRPRIRTLEQDRIFLQAQLEEIRKQTIATDRLAILEEEYITLVANYGPDHPDVARIRREISAITDIGPLGEGDTALLDLRVRLAEAKRRYSDVHPDVIRLQREIAALEIEKPADAKKGRNRLLDNPRYLQLRSQINGIDTELGTLRTRSPELVQKIEEYEDRLMRTPHIESEYQALSRKLETARESFDNLQDRLVIARQTEALESTEIGARLTAVESAGLPSSPSGPARLVIVLVGSFLACTLGLGLVLVAEMTDMTVRSSNDIASVMQMVPIATIPVIQNSLSRSKGNRGFIVTLGTILIIALVVIYVYFTALY